MHLVHICERCIANLIIILAASAFRERLWPVRNNNAAATSAHKKAHTHTHIHSYTYIFISHQHRKCTFCVRGEHFIYCMRSFVCVGAVFVVFVYPAIRRAFAILTQGSTKCIRQHDSSDSLNNIYIRCVAKRTREFL